MKSVNSGKYTTEIPRGAAFDRGIKATSWLYYAPRLKAINED